MPNYEAAARRAARKYGVNPDIFVAQLIQESGLRENVGSPAGARDIAQFMPATARQYGVTLGDNRVSDDLDGAARYMRDNLRRVGGDYAKALSIYNSGRPDGYLSIPETKHYVATILNGRSPRSSPPSRSTSPASTASEPVTTTIDRSADRQQALLGYLQQRHDPNALLALGTQLKGLQDITTTTPGSPSSPDSGLQAGGGGGQLDAILKEANEIDRAQLPYKWGGGHSASNKRGSKLVPLDCSGAVSRALGVNARVSGEFAKWGAPGKGKQVTIYANSTHVLMRIGNRFWGTSGSNPGGGAGWIPASAISADYLKRFTARHPPGL